MRQGVKWTWAAKTAPPVSHWEVLKVIRFIVNDDEGEKSSARNQFLLLLPCPPLCWWMTVKDCKRNEAEGRKSEGKKRQRSLNTIIKSKKFVSPFLRWRVLEKTRSMFSRSYSCLNQSHDHKQAVIDAWISWAKFFFSKGCFLHVNKLKRMMTLWGVTVIDGQTSVFFLPFNLWKWKSNQSVCKFLKH